MKTVSHDAPPSREERAAPERGQRVRSEWLGGTRKHGNRHRSITPRNEPAAADAAFALDAAAITDLAAWDQGIEIEPMREAVDEAADQAADHLLLHRSADTFGKSSDDLVADWTLPTHPLGKTEQLGAAQGDVFCAFRMVDWHMLISPALGAARGLDLPSRYGHSHPAHPADSTMTVKPANVFSALRQCPRATTAHSPATLSATEASQAMSLAVGPGECAVMRSSPIVHYNE